MNIEQLKKAGISLSYSPSSMTPEIPTITDVLYALRLSEEEQYLSAASVNFTTYIRNVYLVVAVVAEELLRFRYSDEVVRATITEAIRDLAPAGAPLSFDPVAVVNRALCEEVPPRQ